MFQKIPKLGYLVFVWSNLSFDLDPTPTQDQSSEIFKKSYFLEGCG